MALHTTPRQPHLHHLPATPETVHWGYFDGTLYTAAYHLLRRYGGVGDADPPGGGRPGPVDG